MHTIAHLRRLPTDRRKFFLIPRRTRLSSSASSRFGGVPTLAPAHAQWEVNRLRRPREEHLTVAWNALRKSHPFLDAGNRNEYVITRRYLSRNSGEREVNRHVESFSDGGKAYEWRIMPWNGAVLIVHELNAAIEAEDSAVITPQPEGNALDFRFGERVFRIVLRCPWPQGRRVGTADVLLVLSRPDR